MTGYRLYFLDYSGHFREARSFECADDAEADRTARALSDRRSMELWAGERLVRAYEHAPDAEHRA